jgi:peptide chain release factor subunit 3
VDREKEPVNLVFMGHVDAGKSTLSGRILLDLKTVDEQEMRKYEAEAK